MNEDYKEDSGCFGRGLIILLVVGVIFFGLLVGVCGFRPFQ